MVPVPLATLALGAALVGQIVLFRYLNGSSVGSGTVRSSGAGRAGRAGTAAAATAEQPGRTAVTQDATVHCPHCGAPNGDVETFRYCGDCLTQIR